MTKFFTHALLGSFFFFSLSGKSQQNSYVCGSEIPSAQWEQEISRLISEKKLQNQAAKGQVPLYVIPVIIHVIHGGEPVGTYPNLAQGQLVSQIQVLNNDFAGIGHNSGTYPNAAFSTFAATNTNVSPNSLDNFSRIKIADCRIEFCLAKYDTLGNLLPEPGIDRVDYTTRSGWQNPAGIFSYSGFKSFIDGTVKPATVWNVSKYLNIWISDENLSVVGLLGYATFPPFANLGLPGNGGTNTTDGFWCYAQAFGSVDYFPNGTYFGSNNRGRTSTHEIGHYLGLRHIWGDGVCATDHCDDTPPAEDKNFGNPSYPLNTTAGCGGNSPDGEMFMNFMDYTDDGTKYMFTEDQAIRMQTAMSNSPYRKFLGTHNLCNVVPVAATSSFSLPSSICGNGAVLTPTNHAKGTPAPSYTWNVSGNGSAMPGANSPFVTLALPSAGIYTITLTTDNGTISSTSKVYTVNPVPVVVIAGAPQTVCDGAAVTLSATGASSYTWQPMSIVSNTYSYIANGNLTFTVQGTGTGNCKGSTMMTISSQICTDIDKANAFSGGLNVYPNPSTGILSINNQGAISELRITDISGKVLYEDIQKGSAELTLDITLWEAGVYFISVHGHDGSVISRKVIKQ